MNYRNFCNWEGKIRKRETYVWYKIWKRTSYYSGGNNYRIRKLIISVSVKASITYNLLRSSSGFSNRQRFRRTLWRYWLKFIDQRILNNLVHLSERREKGECWVKCLAIPKNVFEIFTCCSYNQNNNIVVNMDKNYCFLSLFYWSVRVVLTSFRSIFPILNSVVKGRQTELPRNNTILLTSILFHSSTNYLLKKDLNYHYQKERQE